MLDQTVDQNTPSRRPDEGQLAHARERVAHRFFEILLEEPDDLHICRGID